MDILSYILSRNYIKKSLVGMGALKGAPCTISEIINNPDGSHDVVFSWKDNEGVTHTSTLTVENGKDGTNGKDGINGTNGKDGTNGINGVDGTSPTMNVTPIEGGNRITFSTINPPQVVSMDVMDGDAIDNIGDSDISSIGDGTITGAIVDLEEQISNIDVESGSKNLLPNENKSQIKSGVEFVINNDGTITVNGNPPTSSTGIYQYVTLPAGTYKMSGCPSGGSSARYYMEIGSKDVVDYGEGATFTLEQEETIQVTLARISRHIETSIVDLVFKPMITLASEPNSDYDHYVPYCKTNFELTKEISGKLNVTSQYAYSRYKEWQSENTTATISMTSQRGKKNVMLMSDENVAFIFCDSNSEPIVTKIKGFENLSITLNSGTLANEGTAVYNISGLIANASNIIIDWSPSSNTSNYNDTITITNV